MFCSNCGFQNTMGDRFCKKCGSLLQNTNVQQPNQSQMPNYQQPINSYQSEQPQNNYGNLDSNYVNKAVNPNMKKWVILSIIVPVVGIIWYWYIGLSVYIAIAIAFVGFEFAKKGEMANKNLALVGKVLNGLLCGLAIVMLILYLIGSFNS